MCRPRDGIRVDLIFSFTAYERQAMTRVRTVRIGETEVRFASMEDLVIHKMIAGRPRDLEDVKSILLKNAIMDVAHIRHWLSEFSPATGEALVKRFDQLAKEAGGE